MPKYPTQLARLRLKNSKSTEERQTVELANGRKSIHGGHNHSAECRKSCQAARRRDRPVRGGISIAQPTAALLAPVAIRLLAAACCSQNLWPSSATDTL